MMSSHKVNFLQKNVVCKIESCLFLHQPHLCHVYFYIRVTQRWKTKSLFALVRESDQTITLSSRVFSFFFLTNVQSKNNYQTRKEEIL